jgi:hypothetical protein
MGGIAGGANGIMNGDGRYGVARGSAGVVPVVDPSVARALPTKMTAGDAWDRRQAYRMRCRWSTGVARVLKGGTSTRCRGNFQCPCICCLWKQWFYARGGVPRGCGLHSGIFRRSLQCQTEWILEDLSQRSHKICFGHAQTQGLVREGEC